MRVFRKLKLNQIIVISLMTCLLPIYNNCSFTNPNPKDESPSQKSNSGNGTPYGGLLKNGDYVPAGNQFCDPSEKEVIQVASSDNSNQEVGISLELECDGSRQIVETDISIDADGERLFYGDRVYAFEGSVRGQSVDHYMVACRTTEQNYGAELLVYGPGPVYTFEYAISSTNLELYSQSMNFYYQSRGFTQHSFEGNNDELLLNEGEGNQNRFIGRWNSDNYDTSQFQRMICDKLTDLNIDAW